MRLQAVTGKLTWDKAIEVDNYKYLQSLVDSSKGEVVKIAIPSATMAHFRGGRAGIDIQAYPNLDDFFSDIGRPVVVPVASVDR
jgi:5-methyltetrahydropteroyltriglutamate--homocysteine methyltransferase